MKIRTKANRAFQKTSRRLLVMIVCACFLAIGLALIERNSMQANYTSLLATIAEGESRGNYNAYFGHADNTSLAFTTMTVGQVLEWQAGYTASGSPSNAVGKYQFIRPTLEGLVRELQIKKDEPFTPALQDRLAIRLIQRRGLVDFLHGCISREEFALNLSKEWAALPRTLGDNPNASFYDGDGLNHARVSTRAILAAIDSLHLPPSSPVA